MEASRKVNVGLVAYGLGGRVFHAPIINAVPTFRLAKVVERHHENSKKDYPWIEVVKSLDELLKDKSIDLVVIATPNFLHFEQAKKTLLADKHVIVDKPFTATVGEAQELIDLAIKQNKILSVYQCRRWDSDFLTIRDILKSDILGDIIEFKINIGLFQKDLDMNIWQERDDPGTGLIYTTGVHYIDQVLYLFGPPNAVFANLRTVVEGRIVNDDFEVIIIYDSFRVTVVGSYLMRTETLPKYIVRGKNGAFIKWGSDPQWGNIMKGIPPSDPGYGEESEDKYGTLDIDISGLDVKRRVKSRKGDWCEYYRNIAEVILNGAELAVKPEEALNAIRIIELSKRSSEILEIVQINDWRL